MNLRRRRSLILAQGSSLREPWVTDFKYALTLKGLGGWRTLSGLNAFKFITPRVLASSNPGLELANAFGVIKFGVTKDGLLNRQAPGFDQCGE